MLQCRRGREVVDDAVVSKEYEIPRFGPARKKKDSKSKTGRTMKKDLNRRVIIRSMALAGILGHMGTRRIHSIEAGLILVADGCDMTKGRARIPMELNTKPTVGDIHKYSANSIEKVKIHQGIEKPIQIEVFMSSDVGFFQIEEVLIPKINSSPARDFVELFAGIEGKGLKKYL